MANVKLVVVSILLVFALAFPAMAITLDAVPYAQGTIWSNNDTRPNYNFGLKLEAKNLCSNIICKYFELYLGYDIGRFTAENASAIACTNPDGCVSNADGTIPGMTNVYYEPHWDQTFFGGIQMRFNLLGK